MATKKFRLPKLGSFVEPSDDIADYSIGIFGPKSAGKTILASCFPKTINFRFERWRHNASIYQYPQKKTDPPLTWEGFKELADQCIERGDLKRVVIDSIDEAWTCCKREVCREKFDCESPDELGTDSYLAHQTTQQEWASVFDAIRDAGIAITWLSHCKERKMKDPMRKLGSFTMLDLTCEPAAASVVKQRCDFVWFVMKHGDTRLLSVRTHEASEIVSQVRNHLLTPKGLLLYQFELPNIEHDRDPALFKCIQAAWNNKLENFDEELNEPPDEDEDDDDEDDDKDPSLKSLKKKTSSKTTTKKKRSSLFN